MSADDGLDDAFVRDLLAGLPEPTMPPEVAARIDAALAAEAATVDARGTLATAAATVTPITAGRGSGLGARLRGHWLMSAAAVVAVLALGSAVVVGALNGRSATSSNASGGTAALASRAPGAAGAETTRLTASGRGYTKTNLGPEVLALVAGTAPSPAPSPATPDGATSALAAPAKTLVEDRPRLAACLAKVEEGGPTTAPVAVDAGSFEGQAALVVVLVGSSTSYDVFVVTPACSSADASLLYYASVRH
jgi:hypothetical protein